MTVYNSRGCEKLKSSESVVVVGSGIAGDSAASTIRRIDPTAYVTLISEERNPLYSPCAFHKFLSGELEVKRLFLKKLEDYSRDGIRTLFGKKATEIDLKIGKISIEGERIPFDKLILATGGNVRVPPVQGVAKRGVFTLKTMEDVEAVFHYPAKRAVVIGSGPIGTEAGMGLRSRGLEVSIIEIFNRVLPRLFDEQAALILTEMMTQQGIRVLTEENVVEISGGESARGVITNKREIDCEMVIMAAGVRPNIELARLAGLDVGPLGGIKTNEYMMTSVENIYSCGDCVESRDIISGENTLSQFWPNAKRQGWVSGCNCVGRRTRFTGSLNATSIEMNGTYAVSAGIGSVSMSSCHDHEIIEKVLDSSYYRFILKDRRLVGVQLINKSEHAGLLFSRMLRKDDWAHLAEQILNDKWVSMRPWNYWMSRYTSSFRETTSL